MGQAQIPGLGIAGQVCHDLRERHAAGFGAQRLRVPAGSPSVEQPKTRTR